MHNKRKLALPFFYGAVFLFFYLWFSQIHPLTVYDADDWRYISEVRSGIPIWGHWNPSRVFPEVFLPFFSSLAVHTLMPLLGDYLRSLTVMHAIIVSFSILVYTVSFSRMIRRLLNLSEMGILYTTALFLIFHFLVFRSFDSSNTYLFYCWDLTCYYYYLIPALINASIVMTFMANRTFSHRLQTMGFERQGLCLAFLYYATFSNLPASGILASFCGSMILTDLLYRLIRKKKFHNFVRNNALCITIFLLWLVSAVFELSGGRAGAQHMGVREPLLQGLYRVLYDLIWLPFDFNHGFLLISGISVFWAIIQMLRSCCREPADQILLWNIITSFVAFSAMTAYIVVLCASVDVTYIHRMEYQFGFLFYGLMLIAIAFGYVIQKNPRLFLIIPVLLIILAGECNTLGKTYTESNQTNLDPEIATQISQDLIDQFIAADQSNAESLILYIPQWQTSGNWPHSSYIPYLISNTLYEHGIISRQISAEAFPTEEYNQKYGLPVLSIIP